MLIRYSITGKQTNKLGQKQKMVTKEQNRTMPWDPRRKQKVRTTARPKNCSWELLSLPSSSRKPGVTMFLRTPAPTPCPGTHLYSRVHRVNVTGSGKNHSSAWGTGDKGSTNTPHPTYICPLPSRRNLDCFLFIKSVLCGIQYIQQLLLYLVTLWANYIL